MKRTMRASSKCPSKDHDPRAVLHPAHWGEQMPHGRTALTAVLMRIPNLQDCEGFSEPKEKSHVSTFPVVLTLPSHSRAQVCFLTMGPDIPEALPASVLTCVRAKMSLEVGTFEVRFPAAWKVANIISPSGKVYLRGTVLAGGNEHRSRGKRQ